MKQVKFTHHIWPDCDDATSSHRALQYVSHEYFWRLLVCFEGVTSMETNATTPMVLLRIYTRHRRGEHPAIATRAEIALVDTPNSVYSFLLYMFQMTLQNTTNPTQSVLWSKYTSRI